VNLLWSDRMKLKNGSDRVLRFSERYWIMLWLSGIYLVTLLMEPDYYRVSLRVTRTSSPLVFYIAVAGLLAIAFIILVIRLARRRLRDTHRFQLILTIPIVLTIILNVPIHNRRFHIGHTEYAGATYHTTMNVGEDGISFQIYRCHWHDKDCEEYYAHSMGLSIGGVYHPIEVTCNTDGFMDCTMAVYGITYRAKYEHQPDGELFHCIYKNRTPSDHSARIDPEARDVPFHWWDEAHRETIISDQCQGID
ncbi:MAG: hypothetical protein AAF653_14110, partial [Chloroflexota bacterium]